MNLTPTELFENDTPDRNTLIEIPKSLEAEKLTLVHEGGHAVMALSLNKKIKAYNVAGKISWVSKYYPEKINIAKAPLTHNEGVVSYDASKSTPEENQLCAAAGTAGELISLGHIGSTAAEQESDRKKGNFKSIWEIQRVADVLADRFETGDLSSIYIFVMNRLIRGQGFDDVNDAIDAGILVKDFILDKN